MIIFWPARRSTKRKAPARRGKEGQASIKLCERAGERDPRSSRASTRSSRPRTQTRATSARSRLVILTTSARPKPRGAKMAYQGRLPRRQGREAHAVKPRRCDTPRRQRATFLTPKRRPAGRSDFFARSLTYETLYDSQKIVAMFTCIITYILRVLYMCVLWRTFSAGSKAPEKMCF